MRHVVLYSSVNALDGLDRIPLDSVEVIGVADDDNTAIDMMSTHAADNADALASERTVHMLGDQLLFLRGGGPKGIDITAGYRGVDGNHTYYRAVPLA